MEDKINNYLKILEHRRFESVDKIENELCMQTGVLFVNLAEELTADIVCDNFVIGTLETYDKRKFDIQIYYITDNLNNCYITETELIGEV